MASTPIRAVNPTRQLLAITTVVAGATGHVHRGVLTCTLRLQPSPASQTYTVNLTYRHGRRPQVEVTEPPLTLHPGADALPHVYPGNQLCLSYPGEWTHDMLLAHTVVPWISEWLIHYELWHITGRWAGGGHRHVVRCHKDSRTPLPSSAAKRGANQMTTLEDISDASIVGSGRTTRSRRRP